ncbi:50S ribosome-binding GTPase [Alicyclobacillus sacchari]|uniref:50S ribosome-binding GTPase n=2 Tax=Alicyclobacillus sacchari TaxID=392010 RepID=A0A4R8LSG8_9BACL|nr:GTPase domain-containing protein [Alicyclobacillus sacchari]TDY50593.1 50S ribosome-binding GTPase [Alicyclobacillus sacchari]
MSGDMLVVGRVNAGKTSICLRLARYLGLRELAWVVERTDGVRERRRMPMSEANALLSSEEEHRTRALQTLLLSVPKGKGEHVVRIADSAGLTEGLHADETVRRAMGQTLRALVAAKGVLHVVDAAAVGRALTLSQTGPFHTLDEQMVAIGKTKGQYLILANKMDLPLAKDGYRWLTEHCGPIRVLPVSAREGSGFHEVKRYVWRLA